MEKVIVSAINYGLGDEELAHVVIYHGKNVRSILKEIIEEHNYPLDDEDKDYYDVEQLLDHLDKNNGDGCDFIISIICNNQILYSATKDVIVINVK